MAPKKRAARGPEGGEEAAPKCEVELQHGKRAGQPCSQPAKGQADDGTWCCGRHLRAKQREEEEEEEEEDHTCEWEPKSGKACDNAAAEDVEGSWYCKRHVAAARRAAAAAAAAAADKEQENQRMAELMAQPSDHEDEQAAQQQQQQQQEAAEPDAVVPLKKLSNTVYVGVDLGTENSGMGFSTDHEAVDGEWTHDFVKMKTVLCVRPNEKVIMIGGGAATQAALDGIPALMGLKQLIGRDFDSEHVQALVKVLPFGDRLVPIKHPDPRFQASSVGVKVRLNGTEVELPVEALCGLVVDSLLELGARKLDLSMEAPSWLHPTISVPANATQSVREAACSILAGLGAPRNRISVINEPTAALVAGSKETVPETALKRAAWLLIADLGAGTVDLTLAQRIKRGGQSVIKVECNRGDNRRLGSNGFRV